MTQHAPAPPVQLPAQAPESEVVAGVEQPDGTYKTEFVKVYQDAGVVGAAMLTLLVLCLLLGLFCSRLIKMYITLTEGRDRVEAARTAAIEQLSQNLVLLRSEMNNAVAELRRENAAAAAKLDAVRSALWSGEAVP